MLLSPFSTGQSHGAKRNQKSGDVIGLRKKLLRKVGSLPTF